MLSSERFLTKQGLGNEVPFFICPFEPRDAFEVAENVQLLIKKLQNFGRKALHIDLYNCLHFHCSKGAAFSTTCWR